MICFFMVDERVSSFVLVDEVVTVSCLLAFYIIRYPNSIIM